MLMCPKLFLLPKRSLVFCLIFAMGLTVVSLFTLPACKQGNMSVDAKPDTTSHNFVFQIDTLGDGESSILSDVFILNENDIWAVGQIYLKDASGNFTSPYNVARWDGTKWNLQRLALPQYNFDCTIAFYSSALATAVYGFSPATVILTDGISVLKLNGEQISHYPCIPLPMLGDGRIVKLWGTSENSFYAVGSKGIIFHYNGSSWQKLASGTIVDIQDIWGAVDSKTGQPTILAVASYRAAVPQAKQLFGIQNNTVSILPDTGLPFDLSGIWFTAGERYFVVGDGVYYSDVLGNPWQSDSSHPLLYKDGIRGLAQNDIFITGSFGLVSHYNGTTWKHYTGSELPRFYGRYKAASYKRNSLVAVGWLDEKAIILRGLRR